MNRVACSRSRQGAGTIDPRMPGCAVYAGSAILHTPPAPARGGTEIRRTLWQRPRPLLAHQPAPQPLRPLHPASRTPKTSIPCTPAPPASSRREHRRGGYPHRMGVASPRPRRPDLLRPARSHRHDAVYVRPPSTSRQRVPHRRHHASGVAHPGARHRDRP